MPHVCMCDIHCLTKIFTRIYCWGKIQGLFMGVASVFPCFFFAPANLSYWNFLFYQSCILFLWLGVYISKLSKPVLFVLIQLAITWKKLIRRLGLWDSVQEFARIYDAGMGMIIFAPVAFLSWFPFISTFQSRLLFNQAFSRGLEISLILAGNKANVEAWLFSRILVHDFS